MKVEADYNFVKLWNESFSKSLKLKLKDNFFIKKNYFLKKYLFISPWNPILFSDNLNDNFDEKRYKILEKYNEVFGLTCTPLEDIPNNKKLKLIRDNLVIHYIDIRNKNIHDLFKNYKSDIRRKIRSGYKKFKFIKLTNYKSFRKYKEEIKKMIITQHIYFCSPCPPFELIENLFINELLDIYIAFHKNNIVAFSSLTKDKNIVQIAWYAKKIDFKDHYLGITFNHFCLEEAIKENAKVFSLGTSSRKSLEKFKEKLNAKKALLIKKKIIYKKKLNRIKYIKTSRKRLNLTAMKLIISIIINIFGQRSFEIFSKEIWKRFD